MNKKFFRFILCLSLFCMATSNAAWAQTSMKVSATVADGAVVEDGDMFDETVTVGFDSQKKANITGSISTVDIGKITESRPITNVGTALSGTASGVCVTSTGNAPGAEIKTITIRGVGTLNNSEPLIIIDGVEALLNSVNPLDVESVTVLKDAASLAIYGSRAANGVILITTKKGKSGSVKINYNGYASFESLNYPKRLTPVSNYADYMEYINEGYTNQGTSGKFTQDKIEEWRNANSSLNYPNQDYINAMFRTGVAQNHVLSVTGGSEEVRIYGSFGFLNNPGIMERSGETRYSGRVNMEADATKWLTVGVNINGYLSKLDMGSNPDISSAFNTTPGMTFQFPDGRFGGIENSQDDSKASGNNPVAHLFTTDGSDESNNVAARFYGSIKPFNGFSVAGSFTYQFYDWQQNTVPAAQDLYSYQTDTTLSSVGKSSNVTNSDSKVIRKYGDIVAKYENNSWANGRLDFNILAGGSTESYTSSTFTATRYGLIDMSLQALKAAGGDASCSGSSTEWAMNSFFGRLDLGWDDKYLFESSFRTDGSSRFAKGKRWGFFPSASFAWRMSEENWMKGSGADNLKLRISYGSLGNNANTTGNYDYQSPYNIQNYVFGNMVATGMTQTAFANAALTWETTSLADLGVDFGFLKNRLTGTVDIFSKNTKDILVSLPVPAVHGTSSVPKQNAAAVRNRGVELALGWQDTKGDFSYGVSGNITFVKNEVTKFNGDEYLLNGANYIGEGYSINSQYLLRFDRIIQTSEDMKIVDDMLDANPEAFKAFGKPTYGDILFKDVNEDGLINNDDKEVVSDGPNPKFYYGLNLACGWRGIDFSMLLQGVAGATLYYQAAGLNTSTVSYGSQINKEIAEGAWREGCTDATYPRLTTTNYKQNTQPSDFYLQNLAYLKLRNMQIGYTLPQRLTQSIQVERARFYVSMENLFTCTKYRGIDPEVSGFAYPSFRQALLGINITFGDKSNK